MNKKRIAVIAAIAVAAAGAAFAAQSRTTEFHKTAFKVTKDITLAIKLPDGLFVTGTVKGPTGAAVKGAGVFVNNAAEGFGGFGGETDAAGRFSVPVQPGRKLLAVSPPAGSSPNPAVFPRLLSKTLNELTVTDDTAVGEIRLANGFILSGKIDPPAGSGPLLMFAPFMEIFPIKSLELVRVAQVGGTSPLVSNLYAAALPAGTYRLLTRATGTNMMGQSVQMLPRTDTVKVSKDTVKNIVMPKGGYSLSGTVKDAAGKPLDGSLYAIPKSGALKGWDIQALPVIKGSFGVIPALNVKNAFLPAGAYMLLFVPTGYMMNTYTGKATVTSFDLAMPAAAKTLALVAKNGFVVSGKVRDARGKAAKAAIVAFKPMAPLGVDMLGLNFVMAATNAQGAYRFCLPADTFNLYAFPTGMPTAALSPDEVVRRLVLRAAGN